MVWNVSNLYGQQEDPSNLRLEVKVRKDKLLLGEPIELTFTVTNEGSQEVVLQGVFDYSAGYLQIFLNSTGTTNEGIEHKWEYIPPFRYATIHGSIKLEPEKSLSQRVILLYSHVKLSYVLSQLGLYRIMAKYRFRIEGERKELISNVLSIEVLKPQGNNARALALWKDVEVFDAVQQYSGTIGAINRLKQLISTYPNSVYTQYARTTLKSLKDFVVNNPDSLYSKQEDIRRALLEWNEEEIQASPSTAQDTAPEYYELSRTSEEVGGFQMRVQWKEKYTLGEEMKLKVAITNVSDKALPFSRKKCVEDIRIALTDAEGRNLEMTDFGKKAYDETRCMGAHGTDWSPGDSGEWTFNLAAYYVIDKPGKYTAAVTRWVMGVSPPHGLVVSGIPVVVVSEDAYPVPEKPEKWVSETETDTGPGGNWLLPGLIVMAVVLAGALALLVLCRKGRSTDL